MRFICLFILRFLKILFITSEVTLPFITLLTLPVSINIKVCARLQNLTNFPQKLRSSWLKMSSFQRFLRAFLVLFIVLSGTDAKLNRYPRGESVVYRTIYVDQSGKGNFRTIQSAIDSVPSNNNKWVCIYIKAGTYR